MRSCVILLSAVLLMYSCSSSSNQEANVSASLNKMENAPFDQLRTVQVMLSFATNKVDHNQARQTILEEFSKVGVVHTPDNTALEEVVAAQKKPFAILTIDLKEIATSDYEKTFPVMGLFCRMYEEGELTLNKIKWVGNVWEKINYIQIFSDQKATTQGVNAEIRALARNFSDDYYKVNASTSRPEFYIGKNIK